MRTIGVAVLCSTAGATAGSAAVLGRWDVCAIATSVWVATVTALWFRTRPL